MRKMTRVLGVAAAVVTAWATWHGMTSAQTPAPSTVAYSGYLEDEAAPVDGSRSIGLNLWNASNTDDVANRVCRQAPANTTVTGGWFTLALNKACVDALRLYPSLQLQFVVEGTAFPLQAIGAVPYALRSSEYASGTRLRRMVQHAADGSKLHDATRWWDSARDEECTFKTVAGLSGASGLCLPAATGGGGMACDGGGFFTDAVCTVRLTKPVYSTGSAPPKYVTSQTASSGLAEGSASTFSIYENCNKPCTLYGTSYAAGADIPAEDFVSWTESPE